MTNELDVSDEARFIFKKLQPRIKHLWEKLTTGNYNNATQWAFDVGFMCDIEGALKELGEG